MATKCTTKIHFFCCILHLYVFEGTCSNAMMCIMQHSHKNTEKRRRKTEKNTSSYYDDIHNFCKVYKLNDTQRTGVQSDCKVEEVECNNNKYLTQHLLVQIVRIFERCSTFVFIIIFIIILLQKRQKKKFWMWRDKLEIFKRHTNTKKKSLDAYEP